MRLSSSTCTNLLSPAQRSISRADASASSYGTRMEDFSRGSGSLHSAICQRFIAWHTASARWKFWKLPGCGRIMFSTPSVDVVGIEMLVPHEVEVAAGPAAVRRPGVAARCVGLALRVGGAGLERLARQRTERIQVVAPALRQVGVDALHAEFRALMDIAIGYRQLARIGRLRVAAIAHVDVHSRPRGRVGVNIAAECRIGHPDRHRRQSRRRESRAVNAVLPARILAFARVTPGHSGRVGFLSGGYALGSRPAGGSHADQSPDRRIQRDRRHRRAGRADAGRGAAPAPTSPTTSSSAPAA